MAKTMTAQEVAAIDWVSLLAKLPQFAALISQIIALISNLPMKGQQEYDCCAEVKAACEEECKALAALVVAHCKLHDEIGACE